MSAPGSVRAVSVAHFTRCIHSRALTEDCRSCDALYSATPKPDYASYTNVVYNVPIFDNFAAFANHGKGANKKCPVCGHTAANHGRSSCLATREGRGNIYTDAHGLKRLTNKGEREWCPCDLSMEEVKLNA